MKTKRLLKQLVYGSLLATFLSCSKIHDIPKMMVEIEAGELSTFKPYTNTPVKIKVKPFLIDKNLVSYEDFKEFCKKSGYITEAEKFGNSLHFDFETGTWNIKTGINYQHPIHPNEPTLDASHPVTHVSWNDAKYYCECQGKRLPTDAEWEFAAKNDQGDYVHLYSWGETVKQNGSYKANYWQGSFPNYNTLEDGFKYTSPIGFFGASAIGLYDMGGNVWQWCSDDIAPTPEEYVGDPALRKVLRGGSFLCDPSVCHGFRTIGRSASTPETGACHIGFRCAKSIE